MVLAIDPGRWKAGVAVVGQSGRVYWQQVVATQQLVAVIREQFHRHEPQAIVLGDRTGGHQLVAQLAEEAEPELMARLRTVNEDRSSLEARTRYLQQHPARGWRRLLPFGLRVPDRPIDDYTAIILAERFWQGRDVRTVSQKPDGLGGQVV